MIAQPLKVACPSCSAKFHIPVYLVRGKVVNFRCKKCRATIPVDGRALSGATPAPFPNPNPTPPTGVDPTLPPYGVDPASMRLSMSDGMIVRENVPSTSGLQVDTPAAFTHPSAPPPPPRGDVFFGNRTPGAGIPAPPLASSPPVSRTEPPDARLRSDPPPSFRSSPTNGKKWAVGLALAVAAGFSLWSLNTKQGARPAQANASQSDEHAPARPVTNETRPAEPVRAPEPAAPAAETGKALPAAKETKDPIAIAKARAARIRAAKAAAAGEAASEPSTPTETAEAPAAPPQPAAPAQEPATGGNEIEFNKEAARLAFEDAGQRASGCRTIDTPAGPARVVVTFAPNGSVVSAAIESGPLVGTPAGACVVSKLRTMKVPAFTGDAATVKKSVSF